MVHKNFYTDEAVAAADDFKGRLWATGSGGAANPAQPGRRGTMEAPLGFWTDDLEGAVGGLVKFLRLL